MSTRQQQSFTRPVTAIIAEGSPTPNPGTLNALALSTLTNTFMRWNGSTWTSLGPSGGVPTRVAADLAYVVPADQQVLAFAAIVVDGTLALTGTLVML